MSKKRGLLVAAGAAAGLLLVVVSIPVLAVVAILGGASQSCQTPTDGLTSPSPVLVGANPSTGDPPGGVGAVQLVNRLSASQRTNADMIITEGRSLGIPDQGLVVALAVAHQESGFQIYANDGRGGDLQSDQAGIAASLKLPHDAVGSDHGSLGQFQQQWPWWGTMQQLMDPVLSARLFYLALMKVPGWKSMPVTVAAQTVQRSAYPDAYADDEPLARALLAAGPSSSDPFTDVAQICVNFTGAVSTSAVVFPLPAGTSYVDQHNWGGHGSHWGSWHTGTDLSTACGTPVLAATGGTIIVDTSQSWAGRWLVKVQTAPGQLTTWYAHMRKILVTNGQVVTAGQQIGEVGDLGNATGCHLHFEVHLKGGSIYGPDNVDPSTWLAANVGRPITIPIAGAATAPGAFRVASFNALGNSHTAPGGDQHQQGWASGTTRTRWLISVLGAAAVDVVGMQEFEPVQERAFMKAAGSVYQHYPHSGGKYGAANVVAWRTDRFQLVQAERISIPYFHGSHVDMPYVLLRQISTGQTVWVASFHNPADKYGAAGKYRAQAVAKEAALAQRLTATGIPVVFTGDMNDRADYFCSMTAQSPLHAAAGGTNTGSCHPPAHPGIDWITGSPNVVFSNYGSDRSALIRRTTDHPLVHADVSLGVTS